MDDGLRNLLREGKPWPRFQAWFHGPLLYSNDFNQV